MAAGSKTQRWIKLGLFVSLALNLALIGGIAGAVLRFQEKRGGAHAHDRAPHIRALAPEDRRAIRQALRAERANAPSSVTRSETLQSLIGVLRAEPFNSEELETLMRARRDSGRARLERAQALWLARVATMSPEARRDYAQRIENLVKEGRKRRPQG